MMTKDEATEFFRLWPVWKAGVRTTRIDNPEEIPDLGEFFKCYEPLSDGIPIGSWWYRSDSAVVRVLETKKAHRITAKSFVSTLDLHGLHASSNEGVGGISSFLRTHTRVTPENFKWYKPSFLSDHTDPTCIVCGEKHDKQHHETNCGKLLVAVFGSYARSTNAFQERRRQAASPTAPCAHCGLGTVGTHEYAWLGVCSQRCATALSSAEYDAARKAAKRLQCPGGFSISCIRDLGHTGRCVAPQRQTAVATESINTYYSDLPYSDTPRKDLIDLSSYPYIAVPPIGFFDGADHTTQSVRAKPVKRCVCGKIFDSPNLYATFCCSGCAVNAAAVYPAADRALRFLAGLNLQDHSIKEQQEARDIVHALMKVLKPGTKW